MEEYRIIDHQVRTPTVMNALKRTELDERRSVLEERKAVLRSLMPGLKPEEIDENWRLILMLAKTKTEKEITNYLRKGRVE